MKFNRHLLLLLSIVSTACASYRYRAVDLQALGFDQATAINRLRQVAGCSTEGHLLVWDGARVADLGSNPGERAVPTGINAAGQVCGYFESLADDALPRRAFFYTDGAFIDLSPLLSFPDSYASCIAENGTIAGTFRLAQRGGGLPIFRYAGGQVQEFPLPSTPAVSTRGSAAGVDNAGTIVGTIAGGAATPVDRGFVLSGDTYRLVEPSVVLEEPETSNDSRSTGIYGAAEHRALVGLAEEEFGSNRAVAFLDIGGVVVDLSRFGSFVSQPSLFGAAINNLAVVTTNVALDPDGASLRGMLISGGVWLDLASLVEPEGIPPESVFTVGAISDQGHILALNETTSPAAPFLLMPLPASKPATLRALSARASAGAGDTTCIAGFIVNGGSGTGSLLLRTLGPALQPLGVTNAAGDPALTVFSASGQRLLSNDNWSAGDPVELARAALQSGAGALAENSNDAALLAKLSAGSYTVHAANPVAPEDVVLAEIYDAGDEPAARLTAGSMRMRVGRGEEIGIVGLILEGDAPAKVVIRALGPALSDRGVRGVLADPQLWVYRGANRIMGNDNWGAAADTPVLAQAMADVGLPALPDGSKDAAIVMQLEPGAYTVQVSGADGGEGVALVEVYLVP